jgi:hypothetical protein
MKKDQHSITLSGGQFGGEIHEFTEGQTTLVLEHKGLEYHYCTERHEQTGERQADLISVKKSQN